MLVRAKGLLDRTLVKIGCRHEKGKKPDYDPITLQIYDDKVQKEFLDSCARTKKYNARFFSVI